MHSWGIRQLLLLLSVVTFAQGRACLVLSNLALMSVFSPFYGILQHFQTSSQSLASLSCPPVCVQNARPNEAIRKNTGKGNEDAMWEDSEDLLGEAGRPLPKKRAGDTIMGVGSLGG